LNDNEKSFVTLNLGTNNITFTNWPNKLEYLYQSRNSSLV
jgi:hypothetical protein